MNILSNCVRRVQVCRQTSENLSKIVLIINGVKEKNEQNGDLEMERDGIGSLPIKSYQFIHHHQL